MKKTISMTIASVLLAGALGLTAFAAEKESVDVFVTISDDKGDLVMTHEKITVTDIDSDGALTVNDALYLAHEAGYEGGAAAGYVYYESQWGLSLDKLWGVANGGSYGYVVNNASAMGLNAPVQDGDYLTAYVYTDLTAWSDQYCYFDQYTLTAKAGEEITLTLVASSYDANWNPITLPVADAVITVNGKATDYKTDARGKVTLKLDDIGKAVISATSETLTLVPPVCTVTVTEAATNPEVPSTGDGMMLTAGAAIASALIGVSLLSVGRKKEYEH